MIDWKQLPPDARNQLVAERIFGWKPEPCPVQAGDEKAIVWSETGLQWQCGRCGRCAEKPEEIEHGPINEYPDYCKDMNAALSTLQHEPIDSWQIYSSTFYNKKICGCVAFLVDGQAFDTYRYVEVTTPQEVILIAALRAKGIDIVYERDDR